MKKETLENLYCWVTWAVVAGAIVVGIWIVARHQAEQPAVADQEDTMLITLGAVLELRDDIAKLRAELKAHDEKPYLFERRK